MTGEIGVTRIRASGVSGRLRPRPGRRLSPATQRRRRGPVATGAIGQARGGGDETRGLEAGAGTAAAVHPALLRRFFPMPPPPAGGPPRIA
eukprot:8908864-Pyramimonas_sp.AAC.1